MSAAMYDNAVRSFTLGSLDWEKDSIKVLLADDRYEPDQNEDQSRADVGVAEVVPAGTYKSGGAALRNRTVEMGLPHQVKLTSGSVEWDDFTGEFRYAIVYQASGSDDRSLDTLVAYADLGLNVCNNARVVLDFDEAGAVCAFTVASASI